MIECVLQTNSTVTTTVLQQTAGASFLGLPVTDWITAISSAAMIAVTIALVYYGRVTILEGIKARRVDSIERKLEGLYSPIFEILNEARDDSWKDKKCRVVSVDDYLKLREIMERHGHYLDENEYNRIHRLLTQPVHSNQFHVYYFETDCTECLEFTEKRRTTLTSELRKLTDGKEQ